MKKYLFLSAVLAIIGSAVWTSATEIANPNELFIQANQAFEKGDLERAA